MLMNQTHARGVAPEGAMIDSAPVVAYAKIKGKDFDIYLQELDNYFVVSQGKLIVVGKDYKGNYSFRIRYNYEKRLFELLVHNALGDYFLDGKKMMVGNSSTPLSLGRKTFVETVPISFYFLLPLVPETPHSIGENETTEAELPQIMDGEFVELEGGCGETDMRSRTCDSGSVQMDFNVNSADSHMLLLEIVFKAFEAHNFTSLEADTILETIERHFSHFRQIRDRRWKIDVRLILNSEKDKFVRRPGREGIDCYFITEKVKSMFSKKQNMNAKTPGAPRSLDPMQLQRHSQLSSPMEANYHSGRKASLPSMFSRLPSLNGDRDKDPIKPVQGGTSNSFRDLMHNSGTTVMERSALNSKVKKKHSRKVSPPQNKVGNLSRVQSRLSENETWRRNRIPNRVAPSAAFNMFGGESPSSNNRMSLQSDQRLSFSLHHSAQYNSSLQDTPSSSDMNVEEGNEFPTGHNQVACLEPDTGTSSALPPLSQSSFLTS
eukprot:Nk52_evm32s1444 gene=Nk52_evmTU32s1444